MSIQAMKQALEALKECAYRTEYAGDEDSVGYRVCCGVVSYKPHLRTCKTKAAITALRAAIEAAEKQEQLQKKEQLVEGLRGLADSCRETKFRRDIKTAVTRFLSWPLPKDFAPDGGISFVESSSLHCWPVGTNLLTEPQATAMFEHCLSGTGYIAAPKKEE